MEIGKAFGGGGLLAWNLSCKVGGRGVLISERAIPATGETMHTKYFPFRKANFYAPKSNRIFRVDPDRKYFKISQ